MKTSEISKLLESQNVSKHKGVFKYWKSYFYHSGLTPQILIDKVKEKIPSATIIDSGDHWHSFIGGAKSGSAQDSYVWVKFIV